MTLLLLLPLPTPPDSRHAALPSCAARLVSLVQRLGGHAGARAVRLGGRDGLLCSGLVLRVDDVQDERHQLQQRADIEILPFQQ